MSYKLLNNLDNVSYKLFKSLNNFGKNVWWFKKVNIYYERRKERSRSYKKKNLNLTLVSKIKKIYNWVVNF